MPATLLSSKRSEVVSSLPSAYLCIPTSVLARLPFNPCCPSLYHVLPLCCLSLLARNCSSLSHPLGPFLTINPFEANLTSTCNQSDHSPLNQQVRLACNQTTSPLSNPCPLAYKPPSASISTRQQFLLTLTNSSYKAKIEAANLKNFGVVQDLPKRSTHITQTIISTSEPLLESIQELPTELIVPTYSPIQKSSSKFPA